MSHSLYSFSHSFFSVLSALLCNFYYGTLEKELVEEAGFEMDYRIPASPHLLLRMTDDFLLITTEKMVSTRFMRKMHDGRPELGVRINGSKSRTSYTFDSFGNGSIRDIKSLVRRGEQTFFPFAGFLLNTKNCAVQIDYSRFHGDKALNNLTIGIGPREGNQFSWRMKTFVKPRCKPILFDSRLNSHDEIKVNFYHLIAYSAIKLKHYANGMPGGDMQNKRFLAYSCIELIKYSIQLITSNLRNVQSQAKSKHYVLSTSWLKKRDAMWLGVHAMKNILSENDNFNAVVKIMTHLNKEGISPSDKSIQIVAKKALSLFELQKFKK